MPHYEFYCRACKKSFSQILRLVDYEEGDVVCPHWVAGKSHNVGQRSLSSRLGRAREGSLSGVTRITSKHMGDIASHCGWT
jgi:hypothetical protein